MNLQIHFLSNKSRILFLDLRRYCVLPFYHKDAALRNDVCRHISKKIMVEGKGKGNSTLRCGCGFVCGYRFLTSESKRSMMELILKHNQSGFDWRGKNG